MIDGSSLLLNLDGVVVGSVQRLSNCTRLVVVRTATERVGICSECGEPLHQIEGLGRDLAA